MARVINSDCVMCGTCKDNCPVGAISEGADKFEINPNECIDCGVCESVCPTGAISENNQFQYSN